MTEYIFPHETLCKYTEGVTSRDFIAIMAMQGVCANPAYAEASYEQVATMAYGYADALIKESKNER